MKAIEVPEISDAEMAFGTTKALPPYASIPEKFRDFHADTKWNKFVSDMFFLGGAHVNLKPKEGVDADKAWRAVVAHLKSWAPKHEHKEAGVAYLMSIWFEDVDWKRSEKKG